VGLATGVLQPASIRHHARSGETHRQHASWQRNPVTRAFLAEPVTVTTTVYRPLPATPRSG